MNSALSRWSAPACERGWLEPFRVKQGTQMVIGAVVRARDGVRVQAGGDQRRGCFERLSAAREFVEGVRCAIVLGHTFTPVIG